MFTWLPGCLADWLTGWPASYHSVCSFKPECGANLCCSLCARREAERERE